MAETNDILKLVDGISKVTGDISSIGKSYNRRQKDKESGELDRINQEVRRYDQKMNRLAICTLVLWVAVIIATIILCLTGNDVVLSFLHL